GADLSANLHLGGTAHTETGSYPTDPWTFSGGQNYNDDAGTVADAIGKASSTTVVTCPTSVVYTGSAQTPCTVTVTGVGGLSLTRTEERRVGTDVGTATASYTFTDNANHDGSSDSKTVATTKATTTTDITFQTAPYVYPD